MSELAKAIETVLHTQLQGEMHTHYSEEPEATRDAVIRELLGAHAVSVDSAGKLHFHDPALVKRLAPRLIPMNIPGRDEDSRLRRAGEITSRLAPLKAPRSADLRAELAKVPPLPPNASDEVKCRRAALLTNALHAAGVRMEDPDGG